MRLETKKALVTGASRGIGKAIALAFADEGADVAITARQVESLQDTAAAITTKGRRVYPMGWDVREAGQADDRLAEVKEHLGGLDIVVNNAGVLQEDQDHPVSSPEARWDYIMDTNLKGLFFLCQAAAEATGHLGQLLWPQHDQCHGHDDEQSLDQNGKAILERGSISATKICE